MAVREREGRSGRPSPERILEEVMTAVAEHGLAELTMASLGRRLGMSGGHILYYFGSKDRIFLEALRFSEGRLAEERRALLNRRVTAERKLEQFLDLYLPREARDPRWMLWIELWARTPSDEELRTAQDELDAGWQEDLTALLARGVRQGRFAAHDCPAVASQLLALLDGLSTRVVLGLRGAERAAALDTARAAAKSLVPRA
ncbi:TetR/AcrR family transcriptional regulator [Streptomyces sp. TRM66268-LWL]|uniref:TetR/AcrR family transcriptional regulator n=1 Tax=Streptomyces polyasparticus TaxID=2767826 RepID=A0ABR7SVS9_9ACTN|nr:TetR/AcrR family transcriptional regulator [Streptomyces polyasparticus]MBC9718765.1 TetR/AcrR family transcriptional regulator [Streptomyces polyasparticus]